MFEEIRVAYAGKNGHKHAHPGVQLRLYDDFFWLNHIFFFILSKLKGKVNAV